MPTSITAYTTFVSGTTVSSSEVNNNFSNHRGDLVPINTDTATASNLTHGLGTAEHRYSESFIEKVNFGQTTTSWRLEDDTTTVGDFVFKLNGSVVARVGSGGFVTADAYTTTSAETYTASSSDVFVNYDSTLTAGAIILPAASSGKRFETRKLDTTFNVVTIQGNTNTVSIDGLTTTTMNTERESLSFIADASNWFIDRRYIAPETISFTPTGTWVTNVTYTGRLTRIGDKGIFDVNVAISGTPTNASLIINMPTELPIDTAKLAAGASSQQVLGTGNVLAAGSAAHPVMARFTSTTTVSILILKEQNETNDRILFQAVNQTSPGVFASGDNVQISFTVPIIGWKG